VLSGPWTAQAADRIWDNPIFAAQPWNVATSWDTDTLPVDGDSLSFAPIGGVAITTGTSQVNYNLNTPFISFTNTANLTMQVQTGNTLTVADVTLNSPNTLTLSRAGTGTIALGANANWEIGGTGSNFTGLSVSSPISGNFSITKTGSRLLTLSGANTFTGGITHKRAYIYTQNSTPGSPLGTGPFTFANETTGANAVVSYLQFNSAYTQTFPNAFVNDNQSAALFSSMQTGNSVGFYTDTFSGPFSTGPNMAQSQVLQLVWNGSANGIGEFSMQFTGDWSGYSGNGTTFALANGIRAFGGGSTVIGSPLSIAATKQHHRRHQADPQRTLHDEPQGELPGSRKCDTEWNAQFLRHQNGCRHDRNTRW
jgi:autotransporter-associated beta strand protein